jgi:hypothetical protein
MSVAIVTQPSSQACLESADVSFSVLATGTAPFSYQWFKDGIAIGGAVAATFSLSSITKEDDAAYTVTVTDVTSDAITSSSAFLAVIPEAGSVPALTSNAALGYVVMSSSDGLDLVTGAAFRAFDRLVSSLVPNYSSTIDDSWTTPPDTSNGWLQIQLPSTLEVKRYQIYPPFSSTKSPKNWTVQGSNDGIIWTIIDTRTNVIGWIPGVAKEFIVTTPDVYGYYKIIADTDGAQLSISEWVLFNDIDLRVSLENPTSGTRVLVGDAINLVATAVTSTNRAVQNVRFYANSTLLNTDSSDPFQYTWTTGAVGSFILIAVITDDLGEQAVSSNILVVVTENTAYADPTGFISNPPDGAKFGCPTVVPIEYQTTYFGSAVSTVEILVNGSPVVSLTEAVGRYMWRKTVAAVYTLALRITDTAGIVITTPSISIELTGPGIDTKFNVGALATTTLTDGGGGDVAGAVAFVWRFWDSATTVNTRGIAQKFFNRKTAVFHGEMFDAYGRSQVRVFSGVTISLPPALTKLSLFPLQQLLPYVTTIVVTSTVPGGSLPLIVWRSAAGEQLASSDPGVDLTTFSYEHTVTSPDEIIYLVVGDENDWNSQIKLDFTLPGHVGQPPTVSQISSGQKPRAWEKLLNPAYCATIAPLTYLAGQPTIDGVAVPPAWVNSSGLMFFKAGPCRVLVRSQYDPRTNGVYSASTTNFQYTFKNLSPGSFDPGKVTYDATNNKIYISKTDSVGFKNTLTVLTDHATVGRRLLVTDLVTLDTMLFQVNGVTVSSNGILANVTLVESTAIIATSRTIGLDFDWLRTSDGIEAGVTIKVLYGEKYSGQYFACVSDKLADNAATQALAVQAEAGYDGTIGPNSLVYGEFSLTDPEDLPCLTLLNFLSTISQQLLDGDKINIVRTKIQTSEIAPGSYTASVSSEDESQAPGYVPKTAAVQTTIELND